MADAPVRPFAPDRCLVGRGTVGRSGVECGASVSIDGAGEACSPVREPRMRVTRRSSARVPCLRGFRCGACRLRLEAIQRELRQRWRGLLGELLSDRAPRARSHGWRTSRYVSEVASVLDTDAVPKSVAIEPGMSASAVLVQLAEMARLRPRSSARAVTATSPRRRGEVIATPGLGGIAPPPRRFSAMALAAPTSELSGDARGERGSSRKNPVSMRLSGHAASCLDGGYWPRRQARRSPR